GSPSRGGRVGARRGGRARRGLGAGGRRPREGCRAAARTCQGGREPLPAPGTAGGAAQRLLADGVDRAARRVRAPDLYRHDTPGSAPRRAATPMVLGSATLVSPGS